jgi:glycosyltransferase involved in cell wall biosynthesis
MEVKSSMSANYSTNAARDSDVCIFTIVSNNYLHYATTLFDSLRRHCPQADLVLGLCDRPHEQTACPQADEIIPIETLDIPELGTFIYQYSILELNTAIKPYLIERLLARGYRKVIYFDPDIRIYQPLDRLLELLELHNAVLTPHLIAPLNDDGWPSELSILQAGSYNLGFIALRNSEEALRLAKWWQAKLYKECVVDLPRNLFVDQKWMDMAPSLFAGVHIERDAGWNVAYWNLGHRPLSRAADGSLQAAGRPLLFFHFSGFAIDDNSLSRHQNRFDKGLPGSPLRELCDGYAAALSDFGVARFSKLPYAFAYFADGTPVPDAARRLIRTCNSFAGIDFFDAGASPRVHQQLNRLQASLRGGLPLTALALSLWQSRSDLRQAFPAVESVDSLRFAEWLLDSASREAGFTEPYLQPIRDELAKTKVDVPAQSLLHRLLRMVWRHRQHVPLKLRIALQPYAARVLRHAYPRPMQVTPPRSEEAGVNLIGYLHAESGVGEAARASLRALRSSHLPFSLVDYRLGNTSRMGESIEAGNHWAHYPVNLLHVNADQSKVARDHLGRDLFEGRYTLGYWFWEMPRFPDFLHFAFDQVDEILVASEYNRQAIAAHTEKPVTLIPPAIEVDITPPLSRGQLHLEDDCFLFLHLSDALSMPQRKNPLGVIEAFLLAFADSPELPVRLLLKISNLDQQPELAQPLRQAAMRDKRIRLIEGYLDRHTLNNLLNACDCYVSLHRAEGFGLPLAEAMYLGKPVIATHWSGNVDFMDEYNSLPVNYRLVELDEDIGPYQKGQIWAEPDLPQAAEQMRLAFGSPQLTRCLGEQAAQTIRQRYSPQQAGQLLGNRVQAIVASMA